jgi:MFS family permease
LVFLQIAGLYDSKIGLLIFGIGFIVSAIWLNKEYDKIIIDTFSIYSYIIGFALLGFGLSEMKIDEDSIVILIGTIAICSLIVNQNFILSFISVLTISGSFLTLIISNNLYDLIHLYIAVCTLLLTYLFLNEAKIITLNRKLSNLYNPMRIGLVISLLFGLITIGKKHLITISQNHIWLSSIIMILVTMYLVYSIIKFNEINAIKNKVMIYTLSSLIIVSTIFSPSISGAIVIILLSFLVNYKTGLAIGIISIIYFISQYYYDLNFTLLTKSIILFVSGIMFLLLYLFTTKNTSTNEKI